MNSRSSGRFSPPSATAVWPSSSPGPERSAGAARRRARPSRLRAGPGSAPTGANGRRPGRSQCVDWWSGSTSPKPACRTTGLGSWPDRASAATQRCERPPGRCCAAPRATGAPGGGPGRRASSLDAAARCPLVTRRGDYSRGKMVPHDPMCAGFTPDERARSRSWRPVSSGIVGLTRRFPLLAAVRPRRCESPQTAARSGSRVGRSMTCESVAALAVRTGRPIACFPGAPGRRQAHRRPSSAAAASRACASSPLPATLRRGRRHQAHQAPEAPRALAGGLRLDAPKASSWRDDARAEPNVVGTRRAGTLRFRPSGVLVPHNGRRPRPLMAC
jgi:hypothetical protein